MLIAGGTNVALTRGGRAPTTRSSSGTGSSAYDETGHTWPDSVPNHCAVTSVGTRSASTSATGDNRVARRSVKRPLKLSCGGGAPIMKSPCGTAKTNASADRDER